MKLMKKMRLIHLDNNIHELFVYYGVFKLNTVHVQLY